MSMKYLKSFYFEKFKDYKYFYNAVIYSIQGCQPKSDQIEIEIGFFFLKF